MFPGMGGMNPAQMQKMLKQLGIKTEELNVKKIIFEMPSGNLVIANPQVTKMTIQGTDTYQVIGTAEKDSAISQEDIEMVMEQAGVSKEVALKALESTDGDIAEAILKLKN